MDLIIIKIWERSGTVVLKEMKFKLYFNKGKCPKSSWMFGNPPFIKVINIVNFS